MRYKLAKDFVCFEKAGRDFTAQDWRHVDAIIQNAHILKDEISRKNARRILENSKYVKVGRSIIYCDDLREILPHGHSPVIFTSLENRADITEKSDTGIYDTGTFIKKYEDRPHENFLFRIRPEIDAAIKKAFHAEYADEKKAFIQCVDLAYTGTLYGIKYPDHLNIKAKDAFALICNLVASFSSADKGGIINEIVEYAYRLGRCLAVVEASYFDDTVEIGGNYRKSQREKAKKQSSMGKVNMERKLMFDEMSEMEKKGHSRRAASIKVYSKKQKTNIFKNPESLRKAYGNWKKAKPISSKG